MGYSISNSRDLTACGAPTPTICSRSPGAVPQRRPPPGFHAAWTGTGGDWSVHAAGGPRPIRLGNAGLAVELRAAGSDRLPTTEEQYVCGDAWHVTAPQGSGRDEDQYGLALVFRMIHADDRMAVVEVTVSIQTRLLDAHPTVDLVVSPGKPVDVANPPAQGTAPIRRTRASDGDIFVLMGPRDAPFTTDRSNSAGLRLRLFGEFLEKGVIRKCRPWIVLAPTDHLGPAEVHSLYQRMLAQPLPLTP